MAKIPFSIKYRPQIESGEYKVETEEGSPARIICWDSPINKERPIIAIVFDDQIEQYKANGRYDNDYETTNYDLFLVTTDPELSEFESKVKYIVDNLTNNITYRNVMKERFNRGDEDKQIKEYASELLSIARKELEPKIKAEALSTRATELTKNLAKSGLDTDSIPYHLIEFMCNLYTCQNWKEIEGTAEAYVTRIKAAAMKDLPRWKSFRRNSQDYPFFSNCEDGENCLVFDGKCIKMCELLKLPGFNE